MADWEATHDLLCRFEYAYGLIKPMRDQLTRIFHDAIAPLLAEGTIVSLKPSMVIHEAKGRAPAVPGFAYEAKVLRGIAFGETYRIVGGGPMVTLCEFQPSLSHWTVQAMAVDRRQPLDPIGDVVTLQGKVFPSSLGLSAALDHDRVIEGLRALANLADPSQPEAARDL